VEYIDFSKLASINTKSFRNANPFPWINPQGVLTAEAFELLVNDLPDISLFTESFNVERKYGQTTHDRNVLEYQDGIQIPAHWQAFIDELRAEKYRKFIAELLGHSHFRFRFHWHFTPAGCSVSPHCDSKTKLGSHIFYLNTGSDWDPAWGGETIILDDHGNFSTESHPDFDDFDEQISAETMENRSLIFGRRGNSWHGVRAITCPADKFRKVFIIVFEGYRSNKMLLKRVKRLLKGKPLVNEKERAMY